MGMSAGMSGIVAQFTMVFSIVVFEAPEYKAGVPLAAEGDGRRRLSSGSIAVPSADAKTAMGSSICERVLRRAHGRIYPSDSSYYWYRGSRWKRNVGGSETSLGRKYIKCALLCLAVAVFGSGHSMWLIFYALKSTSVATGLGANLPVDQWWFSIGFSLLSGFFSALMYYLGASRLEHEYDVMQRDAPEKWKVQPKRTLSKKLHREAVVWSLVNSFLAGTVGTFMFLQHIAAGERGFMTVYYDVSERGWAHFFRGFVIVYLWIDLYAYLAHRFLHMKGLYRYVHKWHHRYQPPTSFSAFAMSPIEFLLFQMGGIMCCFIFEIHVMAFLCTAVFVAYHGQIDHSGIDFEGDLPWQPAVQFHDDHHRLFHLNFGQSLIVWDWLFGTLRQRSRRYGENVFVGDSMRGSAKAKAA